MEEKQGVFNRIGQWGPFKWISERLSYKLIIAMVLVAIIPLVVTAVINNANTSGTLRSQIGQSFENLAIGASPEVHEVLAGDINMIELQAQQHPP